MGHGIGATVGSDVVFVVGVVVNISLTILDWRSAFSGVQIL